MSRRPTTSISISTNQPHAAKPVCVSRDAPCWPAIEQSTGRSTVTEYRGLPAGFAFLAAAEAEASQRLGRLVGSETLWWRNQSGASHSAAHLDRLTQPYHVSACLANDTNTPLRLIRISTPTRTGTGTPDPRGPVLGTGTGSGSFGGRGAWLTGPLLAVSQIVSPPILYGHGIR